MTQCNVTVDVFEVRCLAICARQLYVTKGDIISERKR